MQQHYELSDTEYKIMQLFWKNSDPLPFNEILKYCNDELQLNWAVGTAQTYLNRLILKGVLKTNNKRYRKLYSAQLSEEELADQGIKPSTIRLSIGTEHIDDIIADLENGFAAVK